MDISIILVNYKAAQLTIDCIDSIYRETKNISFEIIVVDNLSGDNSKEVVLGKFPDIKWIAMSYNSGFARANNEGIKIASGTYVLLLNTDTIILDGALDKTVKLFEAEKDAVACGVQLLNPDGTTQISGAHTIKGGLNTLLPLPYFGRLIRYLGYRFNSTIPSVEKITDKIEVDWIVGAFILVKKEILSKSGLLDSDFFMYAEEIEWCGRLREQGKLYLFEKPKVIHIGGGTSSGYYSTTENENGKNLWDKKGRQVIISTMLRIRKQFGVFWFLVAIAAYVFEVPVFFVCLLFDKIFKGSKAKYSWGSLIDYTKNIGILLTYFFKMLRNNPYFYKVA